MYPRIERWGALIAIVLLVGCTVTPASSQTVNENTPAPVQRVSADTVVAEAAIVPCREAELAFQSLGRVQEILVSDGDQVESGQELARLDTRDLDQIVVEAETALKRAQAELAQARAGARAEEIAAAEAAIRILETEAKTAEIAIEIAKGKVAAAEAVLKQAQAAASAVLKSANVADGRFRAAQATQNRQQARLDQLVAGPTNFELEIAQKRIELARNQLWSYQGRRDALGGPSGSAAEYEGAQGQVAAGEAQLAIASLELEQLKAGASPQQVAVAQAEVAEAAANVAIARSEWEHALSQVESAKAQVAETETQLSIAKSSLAQSESQLETSMARIEQAKSERDLLRAGPRAEAVAVAEAIVAEATTALTRARYNLDDAVIRAPFSGTIGQVRVSNGELVAPQQIVVRLGDLTCLRVETKDLTEIDITRVRPGQTAEISVDALGGQRLNATVAHVSVVAEDYRGDKVYTAILDLAPDTNADLRWGMTAFARINVR
jgi:HlyD family secretion protein